MGAGSGFGEMPEVPAMLTFPEGLVGLPDLHRFSLAAVEGTGLVELATEDAGGFAFVAAHADDIRPGMTDQLVASGAAPAGSVLLVLLSTHGEPPRPTANLAGPVVVDPAAATARQIVLEGDEFPLRAPLGEA